MRCVLVAWLILFAPGGQGETPRYDFSMATRLFYHMTPVPWKAVDGTQRPKYQIKLYAYDQPAEDTTRFLFELTIFHVQSLIPGASNKWPFYHVGYMDVDDVGNVTPNITMTPLLDPNWLFPDLSEETLSEGQRFLTVTNTLYHPEILNQFATSTWTYDAGFGMVTTNTLVISKTLETETLLSTNLVELKHVNLRDLERPDLLIKDAPTYADGVERYHTLLAQAREAAGKEEAVRLLLQARQVLMKAEEDVFELRLDRLLKKLDAEHQQVMSRILQQFVD